SEGFDRGRETGSSSNARLPGMESQNTRTGGTSPEQDASSRRNHLFGRNPDRETPGNSGRGGFSDREYKERIDKKVVRTAKGKAKFEAVKDSKLSPKQKAEIEIARDYGYEL